MVDDRKEFWNGKRVLVTGHTGFKGTWMSLLLSELKAIVCGYSLPLEKKSFYKDSGVNVMKHVEGDISDYNLLKSVVSDFRPEIVIHFASHSSLEGCEDYPEYIIKTNVNGATNLLEICRKTDFVKCILVVTSDKCYKNIESDIPYTEKAELGGKDPYSVSKVCQELISQCYQSFFFEKQNNKISIATVRASNVIGVGDYNITRLLPYILDCFKNDSVAILRNPKAIRPWQYVLDVDWGYLLLAQKLYENIESNEYNGAYNFGPDMEGFRTVEELVNIVAQHFINPQFMFAKSNQLFSETQILKLDSSKAKNLLNWESKYKIEDIVLEMANFTKRESVYKDMNTEQICRKIVQNYIHMIR